MLLRQHLARQIDLGTGDVTMDVDAAGHDHHARGVDAPGLGADLRNDLAVAYADILDLAVDAVRRIVDAAIDDAQTGCHWLTRAACGSRLLSVHSGGLPEEVLFAAQLGDPILDGPQNLFVIGIR